MVNNEMLGKMKEELEGLKGFLLGRAAPILGEAVSKSFVSALEDYQTALVSVIEKIEVNAKSLSTENELLRGIAGISDVGLQAKLIEQAQEIVFLRDQALALKKEFGVFDKRYDDLKLEHEKTKQELSISLSHREEERKKHEADIEKLQSMLTQLDNKYAEQLVKMKSKAKELDTAVEEGQKKGRLEFAKEYKGVVAKVHSNVSIISVNAQLCLERVEKARGAGSELKNDLEAIYKCSSESSKVLELYLGMLEASEPVFEKLDWAGIFERFKVKYAEQMSVKKVKINWPQSDTFKDTVSDPKIAAGAMASLIDNFLEASNTANRLDISLSISNKAVVVRFSDNTSLIKPEDAERIFLPFWDTKSGYRNIILARARYLAKILNGTVFCETQGKENIFTLSFENRESAGEIK